MCENMGDFSLQTRNRANGIDIVKFVMAVFVIAIHTHPLDVFYGTRLFDACTFFFELAVPFFFLSSGYLLFTRHTEDIGKRLNRSVKRSIKQYLLWSVIYLPTTIYFAVIQKQTAAQTVTRYIYDFFTAGEHANAWQLWYLLVLIYTFSAIRVLIRLKCKPQRIAAMAYVLFAAAQWFAFPGSAKLVRATMGFFYISLGMLFAQSDGNVFLHRLGSLPVFAASTLAGVSAFMFLSHGARAVFSALGAILLFLFAKRLRLKDRFVYFALRKSSTIMYLTHMLFVSFYCIVLRGEPYKTGPDVFVFALASTLLLSPIVIFWNQKQKRSRSE
ncbi:MAG: acyltransferase [Oscillospiraceae bacterium]|nr:acyltransferase [Oscillospiraceae bacterium]